MKSKNNHLVDLQIATEYANLPAKEQINNWVCAAIGETDNEFELSIRVVDEDEITQLNKEYRNKNKPTNVLSFPFAFEEEIGGCGIELEVPLLGDIIICAQVVAAEAKEQGKEELAHWAHMVVHGTLHLLGYDHVDDTHAEEMEALEIEIITGLGFPNPYE
ncbi:MAG: rRNA maturation RNase YbeY [Gammaproteobacteria bacterium]|nr:MAG: rRNA maturation RNase YbeY [Gammaproteobacteria bacterium]